MQPLPSSSPTTSSFATIQVTDAMTKLSLYLQKLSTLEQPTSQPSPSLLCQKLVRLSYEMFIKYSQTEDFAKQSYELVRSYITNKKSYYCLFLMDLMMKNNKFVIKQVKKELEGMMKMMWERVYTEHEKERKLENLKIMIKCWGFIFGDKLEESLRKWLDLKYGIKRIELNEENDKALREVYGDKKANESGRHSLGSEKQPKISEALISSLIDDEPNQEQPSIPSINNLTNYSNDPRLYSYTGNRNVTAVNKQQKTPSNNNQADSQHNPLHKRSNLPGSIQNVPNTGQTKQQQQKKPVLEGVHKSLLEALDLD